jgi:hypothetical protein
MCAQLGRQTLHNPNTRFAAVGPPALSGQLGFPPVAIPASPATRELPFLQEEMPLANLCSRLVFTRTL